MKKVNFIEHLWTTASDHCTWFTSLLLRLFRFQRKTGGIQPSSLSWEQNVSEVLRIITSAYKSIDWFPYEGNTGIYWVKWFKIYNKTRANQIQSIKKKTIFSSLNFCFHELKSWVILFLITYWSVRDSSWTCLYQICNYHYYVFHFNV